MQHKNFTVDCKDGWIIASTPAVDRDADRVMPLGMQLENYKANPVLMYGHRYDEPWTLIGRAKEIEIDADGIRILPELREPANESDPMHIVKALWQAGLLRAASIGFNPLKVSDNTYGGKDITTSELLEISLVPIPANQEAMRLAMKGMLPMDEEDKPEDAAKDDAGDGAGSTDAPAPEAAAEDAPAEDVPAEEPTPEDPTDEQQLRLAAILADFVQAISPYLQS